MLRYDFKLDDYNQEYYRIYEATKRIDFNAVPSFRLIKKYLSLQDGETVLDAGCGAGHLLNYFKNGKSVKSMSIDISMAGLELAKNDFRSSVYLNQDLTNLGFRDNTFDKILCFNVIEHIEAQDQVMEEFGRVLRPDGILVMGTNIRDSIQWWLYQRFIGEHTHAREFTVNEFVDFNQRFFRVNEFQKSSGVFRFKPPISWVFNYLLLGDIIIKAINEK